MLTGRLRKFAALGLGVGLAAATIAQSSSYASSTFAQSSPYQPNPNCSPNVTPVGQANPSSEPEPMDPIWCFNLTQEPNSFTTGANDWVDNFNTNVQMGRLDDGDMGYRVFNVLHNGDTSNHIQHFVNNNHWMTDTAGGSNDGSTLRPNRSFTFENGKLVVEADVAAGIADYTNNNAVMWPEIDVSMAPAPTNKIVDSLYAYGAFGGYWTIGCRLHTAGPTICAVQSASENVQNNQSSCNASAPSRVMEISDFEQCGTIHYGGNRATADNGQYFRQCQHNQMDMFCRDRFRLELTKSSLTLYVNGHLYFQDANWDAAHQLPDSLVNGGQAYAYFSEFRGLPQAPAYRFHWGRLAVNPHNPNGTLAAPSAAPSFCLGQPQNTCPMNGGSGSGGGSMGSGSPTPTPTVPAATPQDFSTSASFASNNVARGSTVAVTANVHSANAATATVTLEVDDPTGAVAFQQTWSNQTFSAGQSQAFTGHWSIPSSAPAGNYSAKVDVKSTDAYVGVQ